MSPLTRNPDEAISIGMYRAMVEQRNKARSEASAYHQVLRMIAEGHIAPEKLARLALDSPHGASGFVPEEKPR